MDDPLQDIGPVVRSLTQGSPREQQLALETYFTEDAAFYHPFCRVDSFPGSRDRLLAIFRWYKILSPKITLDIESIAYDEIKQILYVTIRQDFQIWFLWPIHNSDVTLTTKLQLEKNKKDNKYYIQSQNDLYQTDQFLRFCTVPRGVGGYLMVIWQWLATLMCLVLAQVFYPITAIEQWWADEGAEQWKNFRTRNVQQEGAKVKQELVNGVEEGGEQLRKQVNGKTK